jgi:hypothetical protein
MFEGRGGKYRAWRNAGRDFVLALIFGGFVFIVSQEGVIALCTQPLGGICQQVHPLWVRAVVSSVLGSGGFVTFRAASLLKGLRTDESKASRITRIEIDQ